MTLAEKKQCAMDICDSWNVFLYGDVKQAVQELLKEVSSCKKGCSEDHIKMILSRIFGKGLMD